MRMLPEYEIKKQTTSEEFCTVRAFGLHELVEQRDADVRPFAPAHLRAETGGWAAGTEKPIHNEGESET